MKSRIKKILQYIGVTFLLPVAYLIISLILTYIPVNTKDDLSEKDHMIYLSSNGVHLEIILAKNDIASNILEGVKYNDNDLFFSFGWGDKNFYVETPTWADLTFINGFKALFFNSSTLIHVTRYTEIQQNWVQIHINRDQLEKMNLYIGNTFRLDPGNKKIILPGLGYYHNDDFYEAVGNYTCFNTCNSWTNKALKESDIKACLWTPYDFRLLTMHKNHAL